MKLISQGDRRYVSEDERVVVEFQGGFVTECDAPHPVRVLASEFETWAEYYKRGLRSFGATQKGKYVTWLCPGIQEHTYSMWCVSIDGDWTENVYYRFEEALGEVEASVGEKVIAGRLRKPKSVETYPERPANPKVKIDSVTGTASWVTCGHHAEFDIDFNCYSCHRPVA